METCQRTIKRVGTEMGYSASGYSRGKCGRRATHTQDDGLPLCERHYNRWRKKVDKSNTKLNGSVRSSEELEQKGR